MSAAASIAVLAAAYLLGSISWSYLIVKLIQGRDVRTVGSGNAGATNVLRAAGKAPAAAALLLDLGKGVAAVAIARGIGAPPQVVGGAAVAVVLGHVFPVFLGFRGGKGVATAAGALGALAPAAMVAGLAIFAAVVAWKRYVSLGSVVTAAVFPLLAYAVQRMGWQAGDGGWLVLAAAAIAAIIVVRHAGNLRRLRQGTELRLGERRGDPGGDSAGGAARQGKDGNGKEGAGKARA
ncbi:MAG TPA: glycerol-3-phosphate 1-O-acyltransferase PlsY [Thermoanaerobaculia bacterium]|nr:glycerol-3-phosphate 1-O-acyltransferase PlsY [Thermoanaerobaculia bacterium]